MTSTTLEPLPVTLAESTDHPAVHATLASLPKYFRPATPGGPIIGTVTAVPTLTALRAALDARPTGILIAGVAGGGVADVRELAGRAAAAGVPVVVAGPWALDPAVAALAGALDTEDASLIEVTATVPAGSSPPDVLLDQLALLRTAIGPARAVEVIQADAHGHLARAHVGDVPVHLAAAVSGLGTRRARLDVLGPAVQWRLSFPDPATARPATVARTDADGERLLPTLYESAYRAAWRHLHAAVTDGAAPPYSLHDLADDLDLLRN
ncbi:hypothetical protein ACIHFD_18450 [Nonomuraea sp. NPDC051941]|uniref:hypothetical protein n=1 Tax=Nonomuraea sp. NPDC051941 TaxID=3364373 RepID=UPI0037C7C840